MSLRKIKLLYIISDIDKALAFEWIAMSLDKSRFDLSFLLLNSRDSALELYLRSHHINVQRIHCASKKDWPLAWLKIGQYLRKNKPDIVHCHLLQANILGLTAAKFVGVRKRMYTRHHSDYHFRYFPKGVKWDKLANKLATEIIAPSEGVKHVLTKMEGVPENKIRLIHHGFDLSYFRTVPESLKQDILNKYNPSRKSPVIGVISRFTSLKGIQYIIPAFQRLLDRYPDAYLLLFNAQGDDAAHIHKLLAALPQTAYRCVPFEAELAAVYPLFDVFIQASTDTYIEAFGQTYIEALAAGVPSVFTLSGIAPDFIRHLENAYVVPFSDATAIYEGIMAILSDDKLKNKIIEGGWNSVRNRFSLQQMITQLSKAYVEN